MKINYLSSHPSLQIRKGCLNINTKLVTQKLLLLLRHFIEGLLTGYAYLKTIFTIYNAYGKIGFGPLLEFLDFSSVKHSGKYHTYQGSLRNLLHSPPNSNLGSFSCKELGCATTEKIGNQQTSKRHPTSSTNLQLSYYALVTVILFRSFSSEHRISSGNNYFSRNTCRKNLL